MALVDTHAHWTRTDFDADREAVIERAREAGVETIIAIGTTADTSDAVVALAAAHRGHFCCRGHPAQLHGRSRRG